MIENMDWIHSVLKTTPERWLNLAEMLPAGLMNARPAPSEWSASECLVHLADLEVGVFQFRVQAILGRISRPSIPKRRELCANPVFLR